MTTPRIRAALEAKLKAWADAQSPALSVAWENRSFTPPSGRYCRSHLIPAATGSDDMGGSQRVYRGVYQVSLCLPIGAGPGEADALATSLDAAFPADTPLIAGDLYVFISSPMSQTAAVQDESHYFVPVSCAYRAVDYID